MTRCIIFANGEMDTPPAILKQLQPDDLVIAADGGSRHCRAMGITPRVIVGDLDSISPAELAFFEGRATEILRFPSRKDETDLELAVQYAQKAGVEEVYVVGALGARWDMTMANILLLAAEKFSGLSMHLLDGTQEFSVLRGDSQAVFRGQPGDLLSLIPLGGDCGGITTQGLEYPLNNERLSFGSPRGVSNVFLHASVHIQLTEGVLLCLVNRSGD